MNYPVAMQREDGFDPDFPFGLATEVGKASVRRLVASMEAKGLCKRPVPAPTPDPPPKRPHSERSSLLVGELVKAAAGLAEPFSRADLAQAVKCGPQRASNAMTAWRKAGWIVGESKGWVRTSAFGKEHL